VGVCVAKKKEAPPASPASNVGQTAMLFTPHPLAQLHAYSVQSAGESSGRRKGAAHVGWAVQAHLQHTLNVTVCGTVKMDGEAPGGHPTTMDAQQQQHQQHQHQWIAKDVVKRSKDAPTPFATDATSSSAQATMRSR
jgi:hypothetical protein